MFTRFIYPILRNSGGRRCMCDVSLRKTISLVSSAVPISGPTPPAALMNYAPKGTGAQGAYASELTSVTACTLRNYGQPL